MVALPNIDENRAPEQLLGDILAYVDAAEATLEARDMLSLAGFDTVVEALCKRIVALETASARDYLAQLDEVMARIIGLQDKMVALQGEVAASIKSLSSTKKAASAYKKAPSGQVEE
mgnify:CR=1 FL=1